MLTLLYGVLAVVEVRLMLTYIRRGRRPGPEPPSSDAAPARTSPLAFAY